MDPQITKLSQEKHNEPKNGPERSNKSKRIAQDGPKQWQTAPISGQEAPDRLSCTVGNPKCKPKPTEISGRKIQNEKKNKKLVIAF